MTIIYYLCNFEANLLRIGVNKNISSWLLVVVGSPHDVTDQQMMLMDGIHSK